MVPDMPTRTPVYAPCFSNSQSQSRPLKSFSAAFPSLQSLYALSQSQNIDQFQMDPGFRVPNTPAKDNPPVSSSSASKSHISAQCAPSKPSRGTGNLVVPIAKQPSASQAATNSSQPSNSATVSNSNGETPATNEDNSGSEQSNGQADQEVSKGKYIDVLIPRKPLVI